MTLDEWNAQPNMMTAQEWVEAQGVSWSEFCDWSSTHMTEEQEIGP